MLREKVQADSIPTELNSQDSTKEVSESMETKDEWMDILGNGQLKKKVIKEGEDGTRPNKRDICKLKVVCEVNGEIVEEKDDFMIQLGDMEVVQGLDLTISLMDKDEIAEVYVDPRFGYGDQPEEKIPPNSVLKYIVELKEIIFEPIIETLSVSERLKMSNVKRDRGNFWYNRKKMTYAIHCYRRALEYLVSTNQDDQEDSHNGNTILESCMKVKNNLTAALMKTEAYDAALENVEDVLSHQPQNLKALYRKGQILKQKGEYAKAHAIFLEVQKLEPSMTSLQSELVYLEDKIAKEQESEKMLYAKMLGRVNNSKSKKIKVENKYKIAKGILWTLVGGTSTALVGILIHKFVS
ncbi:peptidyl-prolyl cis-trans isomerase FKBP8 isoform X2 [Linepithema humile]|nr:PREDICTED: peptidyl-prolyl cis-trans isomerase FKBP8 isoform X2 [Linepithema humile]